jgi:hypothetical protein
MLTIMGRPHDCLRRGQVVTLRHATPVRNLESILTHGILTAKSRGALKAVWLHATGRSEWAALHTVRRHGGRVEDVVILEVQVPRSWLKRHGGAVKGMWRSVRDIPPRFVRRVVIFHQLSASPVKGAA